MNPYPFILLRMGNPKMNNSTRSGRPLSTAPVDAILILSLGPCIHHYGSEYILSGEYFTEEVKKQYEGKSYPSAQRSTLESLVKLGLVKRSKGEFGHITYIRIVNQ